MCVCVYLFMYLFYIFGAFEQVFNPIHMALYKRNNIINKLNRFKGCLFLGVMLLAGGTDSSCSVEVGKFAVCVERYRNKNSLLMVPSW